MKKAIWCTEFKNQQTGFVEYGISLSDAPTRKEPSPKTTQNRVFAIRSLERHLILLYADNPDNNPVRSSLPQLNPNLIGIYHREKYATRRLEKEVRKYVEQLRRDWDTIN